MLDVLQVVFDFIVSAFNAVLELLGDAVGVVFFWLPEDPFTSYFADLEAIAAANITAIRWLNWFVPVPQFAAVFSVVLACTLVWVAYMCLYHVMDWIKTIKQTINPGG